MFFLFFRNIQPTSQVAVATTRQRLNFSLAGRGGCGGRRREETKNPFLFGIPEAFSLLCQKEEEARKKMKTRKRREAQEMLRFISLIQKSPISTISCIPCTYVHSNNLSATLATWLQWPQWLIFCQPRNWQNLGRNKPRSCLWKSCRLVRLLPDKYTLYKFKDEKRRG